MLKNFFELFISWAHTENFSELVKFIAYEMESQDLKLYLDTCNHDNTYLSPTSIDQFLEIISNKLEEEVLTSLRQVNENGEQNVFAFMADESVDESNKEQLSCLADSVIKFGVLVNITWVLSM